MTETLARPQAPWALRLLPPFPAIASRILDLAGREDFDVHQLGELVKMDPSFSAELLRFANSSLFGVRREITSLAHAIVIVGSERVKTIATLVAMNRMVRSAARIDAVRKSWIHSMVTAIVSEEAARACRLDREGAYTAGLLHNLGTLGLMSAYPDEYSRMLEVSDDFGFDLLETERDLFEIDHCAAGAYIAQDWNFPAGLMASIADHHDLPAPGERTLANVVKVAWRIADALGYAAFSPARKWTWEELLELLPVSRASWLTDSVDAAKAEVAARLQAAPL